MSQEDHPIVAGAFLVIVAGGIFFAAKAGIEHSSRAELEKEIAEADRQARDGNPAKAIEALSEVLKKTPRNVGALFNLGLAQLDLNEDDNADDTFAKVLEIDPNDFGALACRALIAKRRGKDDEAMALLEKIPAGKGRLKDMLENEPAWTDLDGNPRMNEIRKKHGLPPTTAHPKEPAGEPAP